MKNYFALAACLAGCLMYGGIASAREYHVSPSGSDAATGEISSPLKTINRAAQLALPGDTVTVHEGTYREWVNPLYGGESDYKRILYRAAEGEVAHIKGSEIVTGWKKDKKAKNVWKVTLPNTLFGNYNPFNDRLFGDWLWTKEKEVYHTADVYLNEVSLYEAQSLEKVCTPDTVKTLRDPQGSSLFWFAEVDAEQTTIYANFGSINPNQEVTEVSTRPTCFYPTREGLNYITFRGFHVSQAATQWAAPTAEQVGMIAPHWAKGWIIENNVIRNSRANGITLGKECASGHNLESTNPRLDGTLHYNEVIFNTLRRGWNKENIGSHIVRNNTISDCEQTGICGSMGAAFSEIYGNHIYNILCKQQYGGAEMAGIKLHGAVDTYIHDNHIHHSGNFGIWLDWMAQGSRISRNLIYNCLGQDLFHEVSHGPYMVDNNICLSHTSLRHNTSGGAYINNLVGGGNSPLNDSRYTPYQLNHSTEIKGISTITQGDQRFYNNIFLLNKADENNCGMVPYNQSKRPIYTENNLFLAGARPMEGKRKEYVESVNPNLWLEATENGEVYLVSDINFSELAAFKGEKICAEKLGVTQLTGFHFENPDGTPIVIDIDYFGNTRSEKTTVGPVENIPNSNRLKVWPKENLTTNE